MQTSRDFFPVKVLMLIPGTALPFLPRSACHGVWTDSGSTLNCAHVIITAAVVLQCDVKAGGSRSFTAPAYVSVAALFQLKMSEKRWCLNASATELRVRRQSMRRMRVENFS